MHDMPLLELVFRAAGVHRRFHPGDEVQVCRLISIKTGGCPEDCAYCAQSSRYETGIEPQALMDKETVVAVASRARDNGVTKDEVAEMITHMAFYAGWPNAVNAVAIARETFQ